MLGLLRRRSGALAIGALVLAAVLCILSGGLPSQDLAALMARVAPVLGFVLAIAVLAELAREAGLLDVIAHGLTVLARGRTVVLWCAVCALAVVCTAFFSLDTTALIMTPVVVLTARRVDVPAVPFALATVWLANTASLLLPVSNLTNLLARDVLGGGTAAFLSRSAAPTLVAIVVPVAILAVVHRRELQGRFRASPAPQIRDRALLRISGCVVVVLLPLLVVVPAVWIPAGAAALVLLLAFALRRREAIGAHLVPWRPLAIALALFVLVETAHVQGATSFVLRAADGGTGPMGLLRTAGTSALAANVLDNLPAFLLLEHRAGDDPASTMALLIGVDVGPLITPWASLATLLWHQRMQAMGVRIPWVRFMALGAVAVVITVPLATLALAVLE
ncbi:ArsB/NhaD family transporter [Brachybacterium subflavum]|uniref:SLC13 family permease n=1 Tax=Brachybacterium subflavum TaxID=2585206 RepID=UPI0012661F1E|nr:SLC13 family permease [Brachybacterium subflavum]